MLSLESINKKVQRAQAAVPKVVNARTNQAKQITLIAVASTPKVINPSGVSSAKKAVNKRENAVKGKGKQAKQIIDKKVKDGKEKKAKKERILDKLKKEREDTCTTVKRGTVTTGAVTAVGVADAGRNWSEFQDKLLGRGKYAKADATTKTARGKVNIKPGVSNEVIGKVGDDKGTGNDNQLSTKDIKAIVASSVQRINNEALVTTWEFGVGLGGAIKVKSAAEVNLTGKFITFNGDFQGGENYAVLGEGNAYGKLSIPGTDVGLQTGGYIKNKLPNHVSDGKIDGGFDIIKITAFEKSGFSADLVSSLTDLEQDILASVLEELELGMGFELYLAVGGGISAELQPVKVLQIIKEETQKHINK
ncbi:hypothetical protein SAMN05446037_1003103 [Anaerovirgula multivorans]|uniref:Uncharacterized protein n=1 Tax=Anaerovirgula multivorans TaxID=312168 RepID=A0A239B9Z0_9FIRM|nr:hypothetical protein [Anaerovirgula multivorans]SNS04432.1 hypothetical protein SAMN05446037_1003103 [Anaerovirgula multivorans]